MVKLTLVKYSIIINNGYYGLDQDWQEKLILETQKGIGQWIKI